MNANELRVGNKVLNVDKVIVTVTELRDEFYLNEAGHGSLYKTSNGIHLSLKYWRSAKGLKALNRTQKIYSDQGKCLLC